MPPQLPRLLVGWLVLFPLGAVAQAQWQPGQPAPRQGTVPLPLIDSSDVLDYVFADAPKEGEEKSGDDSKDEAFEALAARVKELEAAQKKLEEAEKKKKADAAKKPTMQISGRLHGDYWDYIDQTPGIGFFEHPDPASPLFGTDPETRLALRRLRLTFRGDIFESMMYRFDLEFADPNLPSIRDAYVGWKNLPGGHELLVGNQKRPLGLDHLNSSNVNVFLERPMVVEAFNEDARRLGMCLYGNRDDESLNWRLGVYNLENLQDDATYLGDSLQLAPSGRISGTPWYDEVSGGRGYFHWGLAGEIGFPDGVTGTDGTHRNEGRFRTRSELRSESRWLDTGRIAGIQAFEIMGLEAALNLGALQIVGEYQCNWVQRDGAADPTLHGGYVYFAYFLTGEHLPWDRKTGTLGQAKPFENFFLVDRASGGTGMGLGAWQVAARFSYLDLSDDGLLGGQGQSMTLALNWYWTSHSKLQFNYLTGRIDDHSPIAGFTTGQYSAVGVRFCNNF